MTDYTKFLKDPQSLHELMEVADVEDLNLLTDYITDKGEGRIALDGDVCKRLVECQRTGKYSSSDRYLIQHEIRLFGGNTLANLYRDLRSNVGYGSILDKILPDTDGKTVAYHEIVCDVASHLKVSFNDKSDTIAVEDAILRKIFQDAFNKMTPEERQQVLDDLGIVSLSMLGPGMTGAAILAGRLGGFKTYQLAVIVANAIAKAILGHGLRGPVITRPMSIFLGPVGMVITALWTAADLASPAYRVTVPAVIQIAYMRQKAIQQCWTKACPKCASANPLDAKFCKDCGTPLVASAGQ